MARVYIGPREHRDVRQDVVLGFKIASTGLVFFFIGRLTTWFSWPWTVALFLGFCIVMFFLDVDVEHDAVITR